MKRILFTISLLFLADGFSPCFALIGSTALTAEISPVAEGGPLVDRNGHNEAWWREKVRKWEAKREEMTLKLGEAERTLAGLKSRNLPPETEQSETDRLLKEIEIYRKEAVEADEMLRRVLPEEARKAGAPPEWLR